MATTERNILSEIRGKIDALVEDYRKAFVSNDLAGCHANEVLIGDELKEYKKQSLTAALYELKHTDDPMREAVKRVTYPTLKFKHDRVDGTEVGVHIEPSTERFTLLEVAKACGLSTVWQYDVEKLAQLISIRAAEELNEELDERKVAEIAKLREKYRVSDKARALDDGPDPTSNTQLIARLQKIADAVFPGGGMKVLKRDLMFVIHGFDKIDNKEVGTISLGNTRLMHRLFMDVMNRKVTGAGYGLAFKAAKEKAEAKKSETKKAEPKAVETVVVPAPEAPKSRKSAKSKKAA